MTATHKSRMKAIRPVLPVMVACFLFYTSTLMTLPFLVDILMGALCPGQTECSQVIFLMGAQQMTTGLGTIAVAPILGSISDDYGRKPVFLIILLMAIVPSVLLPYSRTKVLVYVWFLLSTVVTMLRDGGLVPAALAYVADVVDEGHRAPAVGFSMSSISSGYLIGTVAALLIKVDYHAFWTAAILQISGAIYLQLFVTESNPRFFSLPADHSQSDITAKLLPRPPLRRRTSKLRETAKFVWTSKRLRTIAVVDFMNSFAMAGMQGFLLVYLKAAFNYGKNQFAVNAIIAAVSTVLGHTVLYPTIEHIFGERVLWIALAGTAGQYFAYGLAWAPWVPYLASTITLFSSFFQPSVGTMVSRELEPDQQGKIQGFMSSVRSAAGIIAPLVMTPAAAISLGEDPPFEMKGLIFIICGIAIVVAWSISLGVPLLPPPKHALKPTEYIQAPMPPETFIHVQAPPEDMLQVPLHHEAVEGINNNDEKTVAS